MDLYIAPEPPIDGEPADPFGPGSPLAGMAALCERMGLPLPPLPGAFIPLLTQPGEALFTSRTDLATLTGLDELVAEAAAGEGVPFVALSHEGYGTNSWHLRYCVSLPAASLFAAIPFGGLYRDAEADGGVVEAMFKGAAALIERALSSAGADGLVVEHRGFGRVRWCRPGGEWQDDPDALATVCAALHP